MSEIASDMRTAAAAAETALGPLVGTGFLGAAPQTVGDHLANQTDVLIAGPIGPFTPAAGANHEILVQGRTSGFGGIGMTSMVVFVETGPTAGGPWTAVGSTQVSGIPETGLTAVTLLEGTVSAYIHPPSGVPIFFRLAFTTTGVGGTYSTSSSLDGMIGAQQL